MTKANRTTPKHLWQQPRLQSAPAFLWAAGKCTELYTEKGRGGRWWRRLRQPGGGKRLLVSSRPFGLGRALLRPEGSLLLTPLGPVVYTTGGKRCDPSPAPAARQRNTTTNLPAFARRTPSQLFRAFGRPGGPRESVQQEEQYHLPAGK